MDAGPATTLEVDELLLRPWRPEDAPAVLTAAQDHQIRRWAHLPEPFGEAEAIALVDAGMTIWREGTGAAFAIVERASDALLGAVTRYGPEGHTATLGLWLVPTARGRGVGTRSLRRLVEWTFETTGTIRLECFIEVGNDPSDRMVERAGFQREGVLRAWELDRDGRPIDCVAWSRLRTDEP